MKTYEREYKGEGVEIEPLSEEEVRIALRDSMADINKMIDHINQGHDIQTAFFIYRLRGGDK